MKKLLEFLKYPSTWKGLVALLAVAGVAISPEDAEKIAAGAVTLVGVIWTFFSDTDVKKDEPAA